MPVVTITGKETPGEKISPKAQAEAKKGKYSPYGVPQEDREIWPGSYVTIYAVGDHLGRRDMRWEGSADGPMTINLDHGMYYYACKDMQGAGYDNRKFVGKFLVGMTMKMFKRWAHVKPRAKPRHTTQGVAWICDDSDCKKTYNNRFAAFMHERLDHDHKSIFDGMTYHPRDVEAGGVTVLGSLPKELLATAAPEVAPDVVVKPPVKRRKRKVGGKTDA